MSRFLGRKIYKDVKTGIRYKSVDGILHTITKMGEPDCCIGKYIDIEVKE